MMKNPAVIRKIKGVKPYARKNLIKKKKNFYFMEDSEDSRKYIHRDSNLRI